MVDRNNYTVCNSYKSIVMNIVEQQGWIKSKLLPHGSMRRSLNPFKRSGGSSSWKNFSRFLLASISSALNSIGYW